MDPGRRRGPALQPGPQNSRRPAEVDACMVTDRRARYLWRRATIELAWLIYGTVAILGTTPPGPDCCPVDCPCCLAAG
jgi:hypothetical protein